MRLLATNRPSRVPDRRIPGDHPGRILAEAREKPVKPIDTIFSIASRDALAKKLALTGRQRALHGILPSMPFALAGLRVHVRFETAVEFPGLGEAVEIRTNVRLEAGEVGSAERGRLHE